MKHPSPSMWLKAIKIIPRLSRTEWDRLDLFSRWLISTRAAVFIMTILAAAVGGLWAWKDGTFHWHLFLICCIGLVCAHALNNLLNDLIDYKKGIDKGNYYRALYGPQPLEHGLMPVSRLLGYAAVTGLIALSCAVLLIFFSGELILWLTLAGSVFVVFYTWPLKYTGLGEISVLLVWGPLMTGGSYTAVSGGGWSWEVALVGTIYALGPVTVLLGKHTDKRSQDLQKKVYTLPVIIGSLPARILTVSLWILQYFFIGWCIYSRIMPCTAAVVLLALPKLYQTVLKFRRPRPARKPTDLAKEVWPLYFSAYAFIYNRFFGLLFLTGLGAGILIKKIF